MIELKSIKKVFNKDTVNEVVALNNLSIGFNKGDFVSIIGSNGAGKTTLLNVIAGAVSIDMGEVIVDGRNITNEPDYKRARYIGRVFQDPLLGTSPSLTIEENLALALARNNSFSLRFGVTKRKREIFKEELSKLGLGLEDRFKDLVGLLSGGQRQALAVSIATMTKPAVLLLDEHVAALDPRISEIVVNITQQVVTEHKLTTLMVTHNIENGLKYGDKLLMMHEGEIVLEMKRDEKERVSLRDIVDRFKELSMMKAKAILA